MARPVAWFRVVRASTVLTWTAKAVWEEIRMMDAGQGCWMTAERMGKRLGLSPRTVDNTRQALRDQGLLERDGKPPRIVWNVTLPKSCQPSTTKPTDGEVLGLAVLLDQQLHQSVQLNPPDQCSSTAPVEGVLPLARSPASVREGGRGVGSTLKSFQRLADSPLLTKLNREKNPSNDGNYGEKTTEISA